MVKMTDIAAKAGVSQATVSLVLNNRTDGVRISEATRQRVLAAARELGYQRNEVARAMVTGRTRIVGFVSARQDVEESTRALVGVTAGATEAEYTVRVFPMESARADYELSRACVEQRLAGLAAQDLEPDTIARIKPELDRFEIPVVTMGGGKRHPGTLRVKSDEVQGTADAIQHLKGLGHQRIGWVEGGPRAACLSCSRESVYREAGGRAGLTVKDSWVVNIGGKEEDLEPALKRLFADAGRPTALLCCCDRIAMRALTAARHAGISVPGALSVVGCGGGSICELSDPPLSSITIPYRRLGQRAAEEIIARAEKRKTDPAAWDRDIVLPAEFVARASSGPPTAGV